MTGTCLQCKRAEVRLVRIRLPGIGLRWCCDLCLDRWEVMGLAFTRVSPEPRISNVHVRTDRRTSRETEVEGNPSASPSVSQAARDASEGSVGRPVTTPG